MPAPGGWIAAAARPAVTQPLRVPVPADDTAHWQRKGPLKLAFRTLRRRLQFAVGGQAGLLRPAVAPAWKSCLWIQTEAPQVGDALMDLAPRSLLTEHGIAVDVVAPPHLVGLFEGDPWVRRCLTAESAIDPANHDFAIVQSHAGEALRTKRRLAPTLPFVSLAGLYSVPDFHRALFATRRLADCLGVELDAASTTRHARQKLAPRPDIAAPFGPALERPCVGLGLGGVRADRTYRRWPEVVALLHAAGVPSFVLAGSANAVSARAAIVAAAPADAILHDLVDRTDLLGTRAALAACDLAICADGGLMHLAFTTSTPVLPLFSGSIDPAWRLPPDHGTAVLRSTTAEVADIPPGAIAAAALRLLGRDGDRSIRPHS